MRINNLIKTQVVKVKEVRVIDLVVSYQTYPLGGGEWSIEAKTTSDQSVWGPSIKEWVGSNGTHSEPDDLWQRVRDWENDPKGGLKIVKPAYSYQEYKAPDGKTGSYSFFVREIFNGRLHGLVASF